MSTITERWRHVSSQVSAAARDSGRSATSVTLMAVSKTFPLSAVQEAYTAGARHFGENYVQEGVAKVQAFAPHDLVWHFIGPLQSNKTKPVAEHFAWVHTIERVKIARRLSEQRPDHLPPLNLCIQVNISADPNKSGVAPDDVMTLAADIAELPGVALRGLMTIPAADLPASELSEAFAAMAGLSHRLQTVYPQADMLSMGMSNDLTTAIAAGSTCVRVGSAIFGPRASRP